MYGATVKREWNKYRFDDIKIGMIEQFNCVISENMQRDRFKLDPLTNSKKYTNRLLLIPYSDCILDAWA